MLRHFRSSRSVMWWSPHVFPLTIVLDGAPAFPFFWKCPSMSPLFQCTSPFDPSSLWSVMAARPQCQARSETPAHLEETKVVVVVCCDLNASACLSARFTQTDLGGKLGWCTQHGASGGAKNEWRCWRAKMKKSQSRHEN